MKTHLQAEAIIVADNGPTSAHAARTRRSDYMSRARAQSVRLSVRIGRAQMDHCATGAAARFIARRRRAHRYRRLVLRVQRQKPFSACSPARYLSRLLRVRRDVRLQRLRPLPRHRRFEVTASAFRRQSARFAQPWPTLAMVLFYVASFYALVGRDPGHPPEHRLN